MKPRADQPAVGSAKYKALDPESHRYVSDAIDVAVRSGYGSRADVVTRANDILTYDTGGHLNSIDISSWLDEVREQLRAQRALESSWSATTHNDRIDRAFVALRSRGVVAIQNAGYTMSDGWSDVHEARSQNDWGAIFFHGQDVERGVRGEGLMLTFGAFVGDDLHEPESLRLAREVCAVLAEHGVETDWDGTLGARIAIRPFVWEKRRDAF